MLYLLRNVENLGLGDSILFIFVIVVSIPGGEPLLHPQIAEIVAGLVKRKKFVYLCTNGLLLEKSLSKFQPSPYLTFSVHLDGLREQHDQCVDREGVFDKAIAAMPDSDEIVDRNLETLRDLGEPGWQALQQRIRTKAGRG